MLDVRITRYVIPLAEQVLDDITPSIEVRNYADEDATITGLIKVYRQSTDTIEYTSELATTELPHGTTATIPALSAWSPGAPCDDDYFVMAEILATSYLPGPPIRATIGAWHFDIKPGPMGPAPAAHHTTHEQGAMDEVDVTNLHGLLADAQTPENHVTTHEDGGADPLNVGGLHGELADDQPPLAHHVDHELGGSDEMDCTGLPGTGGTVGTHHETEFLSGTAAIYSPWSAAAVSGGTLATEPASAEHPGQVRIVSAAGANTGYRVVISNSAIIIAGSENTNIYFKPKTLANSIIRLGFHDTTTSADATDGAYVEMAQVGGTDGVLVGKTANGGARSTTATSYTLVTNTWYHLNITINAAATLATYTLYDEAGATLWTDTLNTNMPLGATGHGCVATSSGTTDVVVLDNFQMNIARVLFR